MEYIITGETVGLALDELSQSATDVHEALRKARQMYDAGSVNVSIKKRSWAKNRRRRVTSLHFGNKVHHRRLPVVISCDRGEVSTRSISCDYATAWRGGTAIHVARKPSVIVALPPKADIRRTFCDVRKVPITGVATI